jgi:hypothetical protein
MNDWEKIFDRATIRLELFEEDFTEANNGGQENYQENVQGGQGRDMGIPSKQIGGEGGGLDTSQSGSANPIGGDNPQLPSATGGNAVTGNGTS